jgi:capsule polysaccharide modification protein KpsS
MRLRQGGIGHFFAKNFAQSAKFLAKSYKMYHAAAGDSGFRFWPSAGTGPTA